MKDIMVNFPIDTFLKTIAHSAMSEKLCLQWNDFKENATSAFGSLREDTDFADVTLACEDGKSILSKYSEEEQAFSSIDLHERFEVRGPGGHLGLPILRRSKCLSGKFGFLSCHC